MTRAESHPAGASVEEPSDSPPEPRSKPRRLWRWARRLGWTLLGLGALLLASLAAVFYTSAGTRLAIENGLPIYDGSIPGSATVESVEGTLAGGVILRGVRLGDAAANPLVVAGEARLAVDPLALAMLRVETGRITLEDVDIFLWEDTSGGFGDLGPAGDAEPSPPSVNFGPDLPVSINGSIWLAHARVWTGTRGDPELWIEAPEIEAKVRGEGLRAQVSIEGAVSLPGEELAVHWFELEASWLDPVVRLDALTVQSNAAELVVRDAMVDFAAPRGELGTLTVLGDPAWIGRRLGTPLLESPRLSMSASGTPGGLSADIEFVLPNDGVLGVTVEGSLDSNIDVEVWLDADVQEIALQDDIHAPALGLEATLALVGDVATGLATELQVRCLGCIQGTRVLTLSAHGYAGLDDPWGWVEASLHGPRIEVGVSGSALPSGPAAFLANVDIARLSTLAPILDRVAPGIELEGALAVDAACTSLGALEHAVCDGRVTLREGYPVEHLDLHAAGWANGDRRLRLGINEFDAQARGNRARLVQPPAFVTVDPAALTLDGLHLVVSSPTGSGDVAVGGMIGLIEPRVVDADVTVRKLSLEAINAFAPTLDAAGVLDLKATLRGPLATPKATLVARAQGLRLLGVSVGSVDAAADYAGQHATATAHIDGEDLGTIDLDADIPVVVDLERGGIETPSRGRPKLTLNLDRVPLATAGRFVPALEPLDGTLHGEVVLAGRLRQPELTTTLGLDGAHFGAHRLPDVEVTADYAVGIANTLVVATHPTAFDRFQLDAEVPVDLDLARRRVRWRSEEQHQIALTVRGADIAEVTRWRPELDVGGIVDVDVELLGDMVEPKIESRVSARDLEYGGRKVGETSLSATYADRRATLRLEASGPAVSGIGVTAEIPLTVSPASSVVTWQHDQPHRVRVSINELLLDRAMQWAPAAGPRPSVRGRLDALLSLDGKPTSPELRLESTADDVEVDGRPLGRVTLGGNYHQGRATAQVHWDKTARHSAVATADVPVSIDLARGAFEWDEGGEHHLRLGIPRIDAELLDSLLDVPGFDGATALYAMADGGLEDFEASASLTGMVRTHGAQHRIRADVEIDEAAQHLVLDLGSRRGRGSLAHIDAKLTAAIPALLGGASWQSTGLSVRVDADDVDLRNIAPFAPAEVQDLRGVLTAHATASGTLGAPTVAGDIRLLHVEATVVPLRQRLKNVEVIASLHGNTIELSRLRIESGGGSVAGRGRWIFTKGLGVEGSADLEIDRIPLRSPGLPRMTFSGEIATKLDVSLSRTTLGVAVRGSRVDVFPDSITAAKSIPSNENVRFVDLDARADATAPPVDEVSADEPAAIERPSRATRIGVSLVDPIEIIGPSIDMRWGGSVTASSNPSGEATADGALEATTGRFALLGNEFEIERGSVTLPDDGSNVPFVDVVAVTTVDGIQITATVRGALPKPELILSSTPSMSESDIFTVLVTGSADTQEADPDEVEAKAASVVAALSNPALQQRLNSKLRVDKMGVGFGDTTSQPILTVGKHVSKKVYAETEYHHNAPKKQNRAELKVEYRFFPRWSVETFFGDAAAGGVDLFWGRAFDTKPTQPARDPDSSRDPSSEAVQPE